MIILQCEKSPYIAQCFCNDIALVVPAWHFDTQVLNEPCHEKTGFLRMRKQRRRSASRLPQS